MCIRILGRGIEKIDVIIVTIMFSFVTIQEVYEKEKKAIKYLKMVDVTN